MKTNSKPISFVIPAYNCEKTLRESVLSILDNNFQEGDEIIIINDASTDKTKDIIAELIKDKPFIKTITNLENKGCPTTRNIGIRMASNPLIFNLDSDDVLAPGSVLKLKKLLLDQKADIASFSENRFFSKNIKTVTHKWVIKPGILTLADYLAGPIVPGGNYLYTKESWKKIGGYWEYGKGLHEFWGFTLKQLASGSKFVVLPNSFYFHRYGTGDSLFLRESKKEDGSLVATKMIMDFIDLIAEADAEYIKSEQGSKTWFSKLSEKPIRLKSGEVGQTGKIVYPLKLRIKISLKKLIPSFLKRLTKKIYQYLSFVSDFKRFKADAKRDNRFEIKWRDRFPQLLDKTAETVFDVHYIYHPAWAARIIKETKPEFHTDISSTLTFSALLSAFVPVHFYDYRPANLNLSGLSSNKANLLSLPFTDNSIKSISCMHTVEHVGLGRYGDSLDPQGDLKAINELKRVTAPGGTLILVVPIGKPKIAYNAHRIYSYDQIISYFTGFQLREFSLIPDDAIKNGMIINATKEQADQQNYGCGCFYFKKYD